MKNVWLRVGMSVEVTDEQYEELRQSAINKEYTEAKGYDVYDELDDFPQWFWDKLEKDGKMNGDTYIPENEWW